MKVLAIFLIVPIIAASAALTPQDIMRFAATRQRCENEFSVDPTSIARARAGEMVNDPQFDCLTACILEGMNLMSDGRLNVDAAVDKVPDGQPELVGAIRSCANEQGRNNCETAHRLFVCMRQSGIPQLLSGR